MNDRHKLDTRVQVPEFDVWNVSQEDAQAIALSQLVEYDDKLELLQIKDAADPQNTLFMVYSQNQDDAEKIANYLSRPGKISYYVKMTLDEINKLKID